jgi:HSP20 family molecular chaperone IbpA
MMHSNLYRRSNRLSPKLALAAVRPAAVIFSGKLSSFSTLKRGGDDKVYSDTFPDAFDESDSLEVGKKTLNKEHDGRAESGTSSISNRQSAVGPRARDNDRIFRSLFGGFDDFFAHPSLMSRDPFAPFFSRHHSPDSNTTLLRSLSPGYEIKEHDGTYEIAVHVPDGVKASDVELELEHNGTVLNVSGERRQEDEDGKLVSAMRFGKRFTIGTNVDTDNITANLSNGVLVLTAPKIENEKKRSIVITEKPHVASEDEMKHKSFSDECDESDWAEAGKVTPHK